jgi:hypothetical protein
VLQQLSDQKPEREKVQKQNADHPPQRFYFAIENKRFQVAP